MSTPHGWSGAPLVKGKGRGRERAKGRARRSAKETAPAEEFAQGAGRAFDRVTLVLTLVGVCAFAIFTGYLVGQYAIRLVAAPLITSERAESPGTRLVDDEPSVSPGARPAGSQVASGGSTQPAATTPAASTATTASTAASGSATSSRTTASTAPAVSPSSTAATQATSSRTIYRVQIGRFASRADATAQAEALKKGNPPVPDAWVLYDQAAGVYRVQAGAFSSEQRAREFVSQLAAQGYDAYIAQ